MQLVAWLHGHVCHNIQFPIKAMITRPYIYAMHAQTGSMALVSYSMVRACRQHPLAQQLAGVITYGAPKAGDSGFVQRLHKSLLGRVLRYEHADDMVVHLPQGYGYAAHGMLRFITSFRPRGYRSR